MSDFNKKKKYKKYLLSPFTLLFLLIILSVLLKAVFGVYKKERISIEYLEREKIELSKLVDRKKNLEDSVNFLKTEKGIENEIREKFRVAKEDESIALIIDDSTSGTSLFSTSTKTNKNFFQYIFGWFFD
ncbi:MAG TPA: hypothetical protein VJC02_01160 [Candidatus Paceibacterota bacterium]